MICGLEPHGEGVGNGWSLVIDEVRPNGDRLLVDTNVVDDPVYLQRPFQPAIHYKLERDTSKRDPTPCDARF